MERKKNIKALVFDFDGTLFNLDVDWHKLGIQIGLKEGDKLGDVLELLRSTDNTKEQTVTRAELDAVGSNKIATVAQDTLGRLSNNFKLAIFSRNSRDAIELSLKGTPLEKTIIIVGREDVNRQKPDPEGIYIISKKMGLHPRQMALIGDTYHDVQAADYAGMYSIIVDNPKLKFKPKGASAYIKSISDLPSFMSRYK